MNRPDLEGLAKGLQILLLDVDGVLTDAGVYIGETADGKPVELKRFDIQDGIGIRLLKESAVCVALVSGRISAAAGLRCKTCRLQCP